MWKSFGVRVDMEWCLVIVVLVFSLLWSVIGIGVDVYYQVVVFEDLFFFLFRLIVMLVFNNFYNFVDLLLKFVVVVFFRNDMVEWKGICFFQNDVYMEYIKFKEEGGNGGGIFYIKVDDLFLCLLQGFL